MATAQHPDHDSDLRTELLVDLQQQCEAQLAAFRRSQDTQQDSSCCEEILRRAADGDDDAFALLWSVTITFVRQYCPHQCRHMLDDIEQDVGLRLLHKFRHSTSPYRAGTFAAYRLYVRRTIQSVCINTHRSQHATMVSIESHSYLHSGSMDQVVMRHMFYNRCEALLPNALQREIFRRRIVQREEIADIVAALQDCHPDINIDRVYRLSEHTVNILRNHPEVREMLESTEENE